MKKILYILLIIFLLEGITFADTDLEAEVDKNKLTLDDTLTYKVRIISSENRTLLPKFPPFKNFKVISQKQASTFSFQDGQLKLKIEYVFLLKPLKEGIFEIESVELKVGNKVYRSKDFEIEVIGDSSKPSLPEGIPSEDENKERIFL
ncbi:MAG: BatD family protein [Candidatus Omnitrophica bacterium]|nr:BatD family protein [Candidatus Omnitrophota bacterium]MCM8799333.1 BatD family protein [Candidatus Omnitrophota bacterium]